MKRITKIFTIITVIGLLIGLIIILPQLINKNYTDTYQSSELYNEVANSFETEGGVNVLDDDVILEFSDADLLYLRDYIVVKAKNAKNLNEIGIFRVENEQSEEMGIWVRKYVMDLQQTYKAMDYFPDEVEKIDNATVKLFGNYVVYSFLNEKDTKSFYKAIEKAIIIRE